MAEKRKSEMTPTLTAEEAAETLRMIAVMVAEGEAMRGNADEINAAANLLLAQSALLAEARACLEPFAYVMDETLDDEDVLLSKPIANASAYVILTVGHVRDAAALHEKLRQVSAAAGKEE